PGAPVAGPPGPLAGIAARAAALRREEVLQGRVHARGHVPVAAVEAEGLLRAAEVVAAVVVLPAEVGARRLARVVLAAEILLAEVLLAVQARVTRVLLRALLPGRGRPPGGTAPAAVALLAAAGSPGVGRLGAAAPVLAEGAVLAVGAVRAVAVVLTVAAARRGRVPAARLAPRQVLEAAPGGPLRESAWADFVVLAVLLPEELGRRSACRALPRVAAAHLGEARRRGTRPAAAEVLGTEVLAEVPGAVSPGREGLGFFGPVFWTPFRRGGHVPAAHACSFPIVIRAVPHRGYRGTADRNGNTNKVAA